VVLPYLQGFGASRLEMTASTVGVRGAGPNRFVAGALLVASTTGAGAGDPVQQSP
jgi:hypothetical protein